jgi:hypothetical protein
MSESPRTHTAFEAACNSGSGTRAMGHMLIHGMKLEHELAASQAETKRALSQLDDAVTRLQQQNERVAELERIEPDLFWDADDPENTGSETLDHLVHLVADGLCPGDGAQEIDVMTACRMPPIKVRAWVENDELMWERIDAAKEAK